MDSLEKQIRNAFAALSEERGRGRGNAGCPDVETLVLLAGGNLRPEERIPVCEHLESCTRCREILSLDASPVRPGDEVTTLAQVDPVLVRSAKDLLVPAPRTDVFDLVLTRVCNGLKIVHSGVQILSQGNRLVPAAVRAAGADAVSSDSVRAEKPLARYTAEVEVASSDGDNWNIRVFLMDSEKIVDETGLRVTLKDLTRRKELHSMMARQGTAVFQGLQTGDFGLEVRQRGTMLGNVSLRLLSDEDPA